MLRGDYKSAGLDLLGVLPVFGEIADAANIARKADNLVDAARAADEATDY